MIFHAITFARLKTDAEGRCFQYFLGGLTNVNALKRYVWSLLLHKNSVFRLNFALSFALFCSDF